MSNFKIRTVENIGSESKKCFGEPGSIFTVEDGQFDDLEGDTWLPEPPFESVKDVNSLFRVRDKFQTVFEEYKEEL